MRIYSQLAWFCSTTPSASSQSSNCSSDVTTRYKPSVQKSAMMPCDIDEESATFSTSDRDSVGVNRSIENDEFRNSSRFNLNLQMLRNLFSSLFYLFSNCFRYCSCLFLCNSKERSRYSFPWNSKILHSSFFLSILFLLEAEECMNFCASFKSAVEWPNYFCMVFLLFSFTLLVPTNLL